VTTTENTNQDDQHLLAWLRDRDAACPLCGYNTRDLRSSQCPECGARLRLELGSPNLRLGPWLLGVVSFALALGFDGVVSTIMLFAFTVNPPRGRGEWQLVLAIIGTFILLSVVALGGVLMMVRTRRRWMRRPPRQQWRWAMTAFGLTFVVHLLWGVFLISRMN
jgi:hypothetical protein